MTDFPHMLAMLSNTKMRSRLLLLFHLALLNDLYSFVVCINVRLHRSVHCSTASPLSYVVVYPHVVLWLLKSPITNMKLVSVSQCW